VVVAWSGGSERGTKFYYVVQRAYEGGMVVNDKRSSRPARRRATMRMLSTCHKMAPRGIQRALWRKARFCIRARAQRMKGVAQT